VASGEQAQGRIGLSVGGTLVRGYDFTVTALVSDAKPGETVTLELPEGIKLVRGDQTQTIPPPSTASGHSPVSWKVQAEKAAFYDIKASLSNKMSQKITIEIKKEALFGGSGK
jgi:hypothetical protein